MHSFCTSHYSSVGSVSRQMGSCLVLRAQAVKQTSQIKCFRGRGGFSSYLSMYSAFAKHTTICHSDTAFRSVPPEAEGWYYRADDRFLTTSKPTKLTVTVVNGGARLSSVLYLLLCCRRRYVRQVCMYYVYHYVAILRQYYYFIYLSCCCHICY